jgi:hypothetical protein
MYRYTLLVVEIFHLRSTLSNIYIPGNTLQSFSIPLRNHSLVDLNCEIFPLVVWVTNLQRDPWSKTSLLSNESVDTFLQSDLNLGSSHYFFLAKSDIEDISIIEGIFNSRKDILGINDEKFNRLLFGNKLFKISRNLVWQIR